MLVGYYTLSTKAFNVTKSSIFKSLSKRINKFATFDSSLKAYFLPAPLIAQLGKNFTNDYNAFISGDELLAIAIEDVKLIHQIAGGKIVYLECEDKPRLVEFYSNNGFVVFGNRSLDRDETNLSGEYLVQMLRYIS